MIRRWLAIGVLVGAWGLCAAPVYAQNVPHTSTSIGVRGGASGDPEQFFFGGHVETPSLGHNTTFRPNVEVGFGDDVVLVAVNFDLVHWSRIPNTPWRLYAGGGVATNFNFNDFNDEMDGNVNAVIGLQHTSGFFGEMRVGRTPGVKVAAGFVLSRK